MRRATVERLAREQGDGFRVPTSLVLDAGIADERERAAYLARMSPHPLRSLRDPVRLTGRWQDVRRRSMCWLRSSRPTTSSIITNGRRHGKSPPTISP